MPKCHQQHASAGTREAGHGGEGTTPANHCSAHVTSSHKGYSLEYTQDGRPFAASRPTKQWLHLRVLRHICGLLCFCRARPADHKAIKVRSCRHGRTQGPARQVCASWLPLIKMRLPCKSGKLADSWPPRLPAFLCPQLGRAAASGPCALLWFGPQLQCPAALLRHHAKRLGVPCLQNCKERRRQPAERYERAPCLHPHLLRRSGKEDILQHPVRQRVPL